MLDVKQEDHGSPEKMMNGLRGPNDALDRSLPEVTKDDIDREPNDENDSPRSATESERVRYGSMLPRTGVHFLPDSKVVDFLRYVMGSIHRLLNDYRKRCELENKFREAKRARMKFLDLQSKE
jgi:hypothetical protein